MTKKILVVYFSHSGNTRQIANLIHKSVGGDIVEIQIVDPYPNEYSKVVEQAKQEQKSKYNPTLKNKFEDIDTYDVVFVGSPNWWNTIAPPVSAFLAMHDLAGKTIVPFCTHGGGGLGRAERDIAKLCHESTVLDGFEIYGSGGGSAETKVTAWLQRINSHC